MNLTIADYIAKLRTEKGLSQRELAEKCGISSTEISRIEAGKRLKPSPAILKTLSDVLGVEYSDLMKVTGYIEEKHEEDLIYELVFRDDETGEIVDVVRGVKEMFRRDEDWANVAYRVSHELNDNDRQILTDMARVYLKKRREEKEAQAKSNAPKQGNPDDKN